MLLSTTLKLQEALSRFYESMTTQPWEKVAEWLSSGNIVFVGVGKSGYVARKVASTFATHGIAARYLSPIEALHGELGGVQARDKIVAFTASGTTKEMQDMATASSWLWYENALVITAASNPALPHRFVLRVPRIDEPVPVVQAILMQLLGDGLAIEAARLKGFSPADLKIYHPGGSLAKDR